MRKLLVLTIALFFVTDAEAGCRLGFRKHRGAKTQSCGQAQVVQQAQACK